jgi:hypothetical protein
MRISSKKNFGHPRPRFRAYSPSGFSFTGREVIVLRFRCPTRGPIASAEESDLPQWLVVPRYNRARSS